jgi:acyl carrier protein
VREEKTMEFDTLKQIIAEVLGVDPDEISEDTTFTDDLGADSLDLYQILLEVQDRLGVEIDEDKVQNITTVGQALEMIEDSKN